MSVTARVWNILMVEDEPEVLEGIARTLRRLGHDVVIEEMYEAEVRLNKDVFDYVVFDQRLRRKNVEIFAGGTALYQALRAGNYGEHYQTVRCAFYTALSVDDVKQHLPVDDPHCDGIFLKSHPASELLACFPGFDKHAPTRTFFRTLVEIVGVTGSEDRFGVRALIPSWKDEEFVFSSVLLPADVLWRIKNAGTFPMLFSVRADLEAETPGELLLQEFEFLERLPQ